MVEKAFGRPGLIAITIAQFSYPLAGAYIWYFAINGFYSQIVFVSFNWELSTKSPVLMSNEHFAVGASSLSNVSTYPQTCTSLFNFYMTFVVAMMAYSVAISDNIPKVFIRTSKFVPTHGTNISFSALLWDEFVHFTWFYVTDVDICFVKIWSYFCCFIFHWS